MWPHAIVVQGIVFEAFDILLEVNHLVPVDNVNSAQVGRIAVVAAQRESEGRGCGGGLFGWLMTSEEEWKGGAEGNRVKKNVTVATNPLPRYFPHGRGTPWPPIRFPWW